VASSGCLSFQLCIDIRRCEGDIQSSYFISKVFVSIQSSPTFVFSAISLSKLLIFGDLVQFRLRNLRREGMQSTPTARLGFRGSVLGISSTAQVSPKPRAFSQRNIWRLRLRSVREAFFRCLHFYLSRKRLSSSSQSFSGRSITIIWSVDVRIFA
jgi:hypothetical protein